MHYVLQKHATRKQSTVDVTIPPTWKFTGNQMELAIGVFYVENIITQTESRTTFSVGGIGTVIQMMKYNKYAIVGWTIFYTLILLGVILEVLFY